VGLLELRYISKAMLAWWMHTANQIYSRSHVKLIQKASRFISIFEIGNALDFPGYWNYQLAPQLSSLIG